MYRCTNSKDLVWLGSKIEIKPTEVPRCTRSPDFWRNDTCLFLEPAHEVSRIAPCETSGSEVYRVMQALGAGSKTVSAVAVKPGRA
jgi:hypothetical protein